MDRHCAEILAQLKEIKALLELLLEGEDGLRARVKHDERFFSERLKALERVETESADGSH